MDEILMKLESLASRDIHSGIAFGNSFSQMLKAQGHRCEIVREITSDCTVPLKDGIPFVGRVSIMDNDFWEHQSPEWKNAHPDLCVEGNVYQIDEVLATEIVGTSDVKVTTKKLLIVFKSTD